MIRGRLLRRTRLRRKLTLDRLSALSGVNLRTISDIEHGRNRKPAYDKVVRLERALGMDPGTLWSVPELTAAAS